MISPLQYKQTCALLMSAFALSACGGGGGGATPSIDANAEALAQSSDMATIAAVGVSKLTSGTTAATGSAPLVETLDTRSTWTPPSGTLLAGFEGSNDTVSNWQFTNGPEFPGGVGSLIEGEGLNSAKGARLNVDLGCGAAKIGVRTGNEKCGAYVAMMTTFATPVQAAGSGPAVLALDFKVPGFDYDIGLRVIDGTGQTLQFTVCKGSIEAQDGSTWKRVHLPISSSKVFYGGANDGQLHFPLKGMQLMANRSEQLLAPGYILFDNLTLLAGPTYSMDLRAAGPTAFGNVYKSYVGRLAVASHNVNPTALDKARAAGITVVRRDLNWGTVEKNGVYNFASYDAEMAALTARGMSVLWILDYGHADHGGAVPLSTADQKAYAAYARAAALHFKGKNVIGYEIWNEPNGSTYWPNPDPAAFASLVNLASVAIKNADPTTKVITGGTAGIDMNFTIRTAIAANSAQVDAVGIHPYTNNPSRLPELYANGQTAVTNALTANLWNKPAWNTEWGISSYGDFDAAQYGIGNTAAARDRQGQLVLRMVLTQISVNTPFMTIYDLMDDGTSGTNREHNFGLLTSTGADKPAMVALRNLYLAQSGRSYKGLVSDTAPGVHALRWDGASDKVFVLWVDDTRSNTVTVNLPAKTYGVTTWKGAEATTKIAATGQLQVDLTEAAGPVFVSIKN